MAPTGILRYASGPARNTIHPVFDSPSSGFPIGNIQKNHLHIIYKLHIPLYPAQYSMKYHHFWCFDTIKKRHHCLPSGSFLSHGGFPVVTMAIPEVRSPPAAGGQITWCWEPQVIGFQGRFAGKPHSSLKKHGFNGFLWIFLETNPLTYRWKFGVKSIYT